MKYAALIITASGAPTIKTFETCKKMQITKARQVIEYELPEGCTLHSIQKIPNNPQRIQITSTSTTRAAMFIENVAEVLELNMDKLVGDFLGRKYTDARAIIAHILYVNTPLSMEEIGELLDRCHSTVTHMVKRAENFMTTDPDFKVKYDKAHQIL